MNIAPDHLERHKTFKNYVNAKLKLIKKQKKKSIALIEKNNGLIRDILRSQKVKSKLKKVDFKEYENFYKKIKNNYFKNLSNIKNLIEENLNFYTHTAALDFNLKLRRI